jgi:VanZ family protein
MGARGRCPNYGKISENIVRWFKFDREIIENAARKVGWLGIGLIAVASLLPGSQRPHIGTPGQLEHFLAYFLTSLVFFYGNGRRNAAIGVLAFCAYAGLLEVLQQLVPGRIPRLVDVAASATGIVLGLMLAVLIKSSDASGIRASPTPVSEPPTRASRISPTPGEGRDLP